MELTLLLLGAGIFFGQLHMIWRDYHEIKALKADLKVANDRLYASWQDGNTIPTAEQITPADVAEMEHPKMNAALQAIINEWGSQEVRDSLTRAFQKAAAEGFSTNDIYERYISGHYDAMPAGPM